ncbi:MAG: MarR family transcriptional regulator [Vallitaleaceae bacterium]|jgi:DNA-binding MarR family transcriptional regulator|nr:MarR family transcriptional regulator [Vallitaleaceae bacterium]
MSDIKVKNDANICVGKYMAITQRMLNAFLRQRLENTDINPSMFMFLLQLVGHDGLSQKQINDSMQYNKGVVTRIANQLEKKGYIIRKSNDQDHRAYRLHLTKKAENFQPTMINILKEWNEVILSDETEEAIETLNTTLERIATKSINKVKEVKNG